MIVSLTSYPARMGTLHLVLESLYTQTMQPDKVILWLAEEQFPGRESDLPERLNEDVTAGKLDLRWCEDLGSHKKYFFAMQEFPDQVIVTVDDDIIYDPRTLEALYESYQKHPEAVSAHRTSLILFDEQGGLLPPSRWPLPYEALKDTPSLQLMAIGSRGILYPPGIINKSALDIDRIKQLCSADGIVFLNDSWLKIHELMDGVPVVCVEDACEGQQIPKAQEAAIKQSSSRKLSLWKAEESLWSLMGEGEDLKRGLDAMRTDRSWIPLEEDAVLANVSSRLKSLADRGRASADQDIQLIDRSALELNRQKSLGVSDEKWTRSLREYQEVLRGVVGFDNLSFKTLSFHALRDHGSVLRTKLWGNKFKEASQYESMLASWNDFFRQHPDCDKIYHKGYEVFLEDMKRETSTSIKVSVILPVHNVAGHIEHCIESLKAQTLGKLEFIFVDDCSTDNSMKAVEAWAEQDEHVRILRNEQNIGAGPSRNRGIEVAKGEYLSFIDPDDWISPDFYELLYSAATTGGDHDIAKGRCRKVDGESGTIGEPERRQNRVILEGLSENNPLFCLFTYEHWTAIWKRELFEDPDVRYGTSVAAQDTTFQLKACSQTNDIVLVDDAYYYYVQLPSSATHKNLLTRTHGEIDALDEKIAFLQKRDFNEHAIRYVRDSIRTLLIRFQAALNTGSIGRKEQQGVIDRLSTVVSKTSDTTTSNKFGFEGLPSQRPLIVPGLRFPGERETRVSVIIPVFNPGDGIHACIGSLKAQLLDGIEFIFIDDCSTDASMEAVEAWAAEDERVRILRNSENLGPGPSRNRGIEAAKGDYLSFVDPDDYVHRDFLELLYEAATAEGGHAIAKGLCIEVAPDGSTDFLDNIRVNARIAAAQEDNALFTLFKVHVFTALFVKDLFVDGSVRFGSTRRSEDRFFLLRACNSSDDIVVVNEATYYYVKRDGSIMHSKDPTLFDEALDALRADLEYIAENKLAEQVVSYLGPRASTYIKLYRNAASFNTPLHDGYISYIERLVSLLESHGHREAVLAKEPPLAHLYDNRKLTLPGFRAPGEGAVRVSVVVPVYNVEPYIGRCIESLRSQLLDGLEFIFVDDCSTDDSMRAVEAWAAEDGRVRIVRNDENLGPGPSRNRGIEEARGDYLSFVDPDDWVSPDFYELLYAAATKDGGHDIAKGLRVNETCPQDRDPSAGAWRNQQILERESGIPLYLVFDSEHFSALYRREFIADNSVRYGNSRKSEDTTFLLRLCYYTEDIVIEPLAQYYYVQRDDSAVHQVTSQRFQYELDGLKEKAGFLRSVGIDDYACKYLAKKLRCHLDGYKSLIEYGADFHKEYASYLSELLSIIEPLIGKGQLMELVPSIAEEHKRLALITPGLRAPGEGEVRVSVILPVYNPGEGINKCIESLRSQLLDGLEFIFVDDCSTDDSMAAVEAWATEDDRVHILRNKKNLGAGPSRNRGIDVARGDYLSFVDPDDYVSPWFYELLYAAAVSDGGHAIAKGLRGLLLTNGKSTYSPSRKVHKRIRTALQTGSPLYTAFTNEHTTAIYRRSIFGSGARYGTSRNDQDTTFLLAACLQTNDIVFEEGAIYHYVKRPGSAVESATPERYMCELDALGEKAVLLEDKANDHFTREYLQTKAIVRLTHFYSAAISNPLLEGTVGEYSHKLDSIINDSPALDHLRACSHIKALLEKQVLLPRIDHLPEGQKLEGAMSWLDFVEQNPTMASPYMNECATAMASAVQQLVNTKGLSSFKTYYSQLVEHTKKLPQKERTVLLLEFNRRLATIHNLRQILGKIKRKILRQN